MTKRLALVGLVALFLLFAFVLPVSAQDGEPGKLILGGTYTLESGERLEGGLGVAGGTAILEEGSLVDGDVLVAGGTVRASGMIDGDIAVFGGFVDLASTAVVNGDIISFGGNVQRSPGAVVNGTVQEGAEFDFRGWRGIDVLPGLPFLRSVQERPSPTDSFLLLLWRLFRSVGLTLAMGALALVVAAVWPKGTQAIGTTILDQPAMALLVGLLTWVLAAAAGIVLAITICLLPIAILLAIVMVLVALLSWIVVGWVVGQKLLAMLKVQQPSMALEAAVGTGLVVLIYFLIGVIPCVDFIYGLLVASLGLGAIVLTRFGTRPYPQVSEPPTPPPPPALPPAPGQPAEVQEGGPFSTEATSEDATAAQ